MHNPLILTRKMEVCPHNLQSTLPSCLTQSNLVQTCRQFPKFCNPKKFRGCRKFHLVHISAQQSSGASIKCSATAETTSDTVISKDEDVVFVAGATGRVGSRTVRELLKLGFRVRAGVRSEQRAESLVQSVRQMKLDTEASDGLPPIEKLEVVECDLEQPDRIIPALGRASLVICCIGASEKEIFDVTGPYRIDYLATKNLIEAATFAKVNHFILLTSLGTNKVGFPAAILNLFWGVLIWKRKAEEALLDSGLPYTIVRPGGMERPTDSFKETHNLTLSPEDTLFGGLVSNLQVAELMAFMARNLDLSYCKVVEGVAETTAPLTPMGELLEKIPSKRDDISKAKSSSPSSQGQKIGTPDTSSGASTPSGVSETDAGTSKSEAGRLQKLQPLSPYTAYEDLKPPSSPSPSPPDNSRKESLLTLKTVDGVPKIIDGTWMEEVQQIFYHSPYPVYDELKPPTSPTPSAPNSLSTYTASSNAESQIANTSSNKKVESITEEKTGDEQKPTKTKLRPLSPYTMYDDLKPPTSPMPAPKNC